MSLNISLDQFRSISDGKYNAGQIDVAVKKDGTATLKKVNTHIHLTALNTATIDPAQTLEIKQAFVRALAPHINEESLTRIREDLGLPATEGGTVRSGHAYEPLTRQQVREILDAYMPPEARQARAEDAKRTSVRASVNAANLAAQPVRVGDQALKLDKIGTDKIEAEGFGLPAKVEGTSIYIRDTLAIEEAEAGMKKAADAMIKVLTRPDGGRVDLTTLVRKLNTMAAYAERIALFDSANPTRAELGAHINATLARALDQLDNGKLALVYQGTMSRELDGLKAEIAHRMESLSTVPSQFDLCEAVLEGISRMEARVVSEVSYRVGLEKIPLDQRATVQAPVQRWCGDAAAPTAHNDVRDMTTANLEILARRTTDELLHADAKLDGVDARIRSHGFTAADSRKIGDMIRGNELTLNIYLSNLLGWRDGQAPALADPNFALRNTFASKEAQGLALDGTGYLVKRDEVEKYFFPEYGSAPPKGHERPLYAAFNPQKLQSGGTSTYGNTVIVLKQHVKQQATYTLDDTFFSLKVSTTAESRTRFVAALAEALAGRVTQEAIDSLATPGSEAFNELDAFYDMYGGEDVVVQGADNLCVRLATILAPAHVGEKRMLDKDDIYAAMIRSTSVAPNPASLAATYDNIETLLAPAGDFQAVGFAVNTLHRMRDPNAPVKMLGCTYIEAQLHGPILLGRDVEEIRIHVGDIEDHFADEYERLDVKPENITKEAWVADKCARQRQDILDMAKVSDVKIVFYGEDADPASTALYDNIVKDVADTRSLLRESILRAANAVLDGDMSGVFRECCAKLPPEDRAHFVHAYGKDLASMPGWMKDLFRTVASQVKRTINDRNDQGVVDEASMMNALTYKVREAMGAIVPVFAALDKHGVTDAARRDEFLHEFVNTRMAASKADAFIAAKAALDRAAAAPWTLVAASMTADFPASLRTELSALGAKEGLPLAGKGLENLMGKVAEFLVGKMSSGGTTTVDKLLAEAREQIVTPALKARINLVRPIANWDFPSEDDRKAFVEWAVNSGKLKALEEVKGVYAASSKLADGLAAALAGDGALDMDRLMAIHREFVDVVSRYGDLASRAGLEIGTDDLNALVFRPVNVAMSRLFLRVGQGGMDRLGAALSTPEIRSLFDASTSVLANAPKLAASIDTTRVHVLQNFLYSMSDRLDEKYGQHCRFDANQIAPFATVSPAMRQVLSGVASELIGTMSAKVPYAAPYRAMPAAANPAGLPTNLAGRKRFLRAALPAYHQHEKTFENGRNTHGRTHATRAFVFANVLGNILAERGVPVDMNALSLGIAGHDMGRQASGEDKWERESGDLTTTMGERLTGGAGGIEWCGAVKANIAGKAPELASQRTIEGYLLKAADSLDYSRVKPLDPDHFHFMEAAFSCGAVVVNPDLSLRDELMKEAAELTRLTDPYTLRSGELNELMVQGTSDGTKWNEYTNLKDEVMAAEINQTDRLSDDQVIDLVEQTIRANPEKFPLLNQYYR